MDRSRSIHHVSTILRLTDLWPTFPRPITAGLAFLLLLVGWQPSSAQRTDSIPGSLYFIAVEEFYRGELRRAERVFRREAIGSVKIGTTRWIDAIAYHAMLGEVRFQMGRNGEALAEFDQACQLFLQYPNWLLRVKFGRSPGPDASRARRPPPPWGRSERTFTLGNISDTELMSFGRLTTKDDLRQGGVLEPPMFFRINPAEIVRATCLAIRRRNRLLGPLGKYDRISKELVDALSRGGNAAPNHWSGAWVELQLALAQIGVGNEQEAQTHLSQAVIVDGRYDHPLTCVALLEQGRLAAASGDAARAARLLAEASFSAYYFDDWQVLDEAMGWGQLNHLVVDGPGVFPPLEPAAGWTRRAGLSLLTTNLQVDLAENLTLRGEADRAASILDETARRIGEAASSRSGIDALYVQALIHYRQDRIEAGDEVLNQALIRQSAASERNFQILRANLLFDGEQGQRITARTAVPLYARLLADPRPSEWAQHPLDTLAVSMTAHAGAFDRWFSAAAARKDAKLLFEVAERTKRRRFFAALPRGGRMLALRTLLEAPLADLDDPSQLRRKQLLGRFPNYRELSQQADQLRREVRQDAVLPAEADDSSAAAARYDRWAKIIQLQEARLREMSIERIPTAQIYPPLISVTDLQQRLPPNAALAAFHAAGDELFGFLLSREEMHSWRIGPTRQLRQGTAEFLRAIGNYGAARSLSTEELADEQWRGPANSLYQQIMGKSRLDVAATGELIVVPDDVLWHVPLEALPAGDETAELVSESMLVRYAPTAGLALGDPRAGARLLHTALVIPSSLAGPQEDVTDRFKAIVTGPVLLPTPLPEPAPLVTAVVDQLIVLEDRQLPLDSPFELQLLPRARGRSNGQLGELLGLPFGGPQHVVLGNLSTAAESGLKASRRSSTRNLRPGHELFLATCGLLANRTQTILMSRWRTGGQTNLELIREFAQELPHAPAAEAWQRSVLLAREMPLDPAHESRLKQPDEIGQILTADHPFFWAGYLLVDTGGAVRGDPAKDEPRPPQPSNRAAPAKSAAKPPDEAPPARDASSDPS